jgi:hypothetical protein
MISCVGIEKDKNLLIYPLGKGSQKAKPSEKTESKNVNYNKLLNKSSFMRSGQERGTKI